MSRIKFANGKVVNFQGDPTPEDIEEVAASFDDHSVVGSASKFLTSPSAFPLSPMALIRATKDVGSAGFAADKNYPAENLLPGAGAVAGGIMGGASGIPFGGTLGSMEGAQVGETGRQYIRALRGKSVPSTPMEALGKTMIPAAEAGTAELGTAGIVKGLKTVGAGKLAKEGMTRFSNKMMDLMRPQAKELTEKSFEQIKNLKAIPIQESSTAKTIGDIFQKRGIFSDSGGLTPTQIQNFKDAGMSSEDVASIKETAQTLGKGVSRISKGKSGVTIGSELKTTPLRQYQELANVLDDLEKPNLTYGQLRQLRTRVGDIANFDKPDIERTAIEKLHGMVYNELGKDMEKTAEIEGLGSVHKNVLDEGRKFYQEKLLKNILDDSMTRTKGISRIKYSDLANNLKSYSEEELTRKFGDQADYIRTLRDVAETHAETFGQGQMLRSHVGIRGNVFASMNPHPIAKARTPVYIDKILTKYLGEDGLKEYKDVLFSRLSSARGTLGAGVKGIVMPPFAGVADENQ